MVSNYRNNIPRLPLDGKLDLTYRCNNTCQHCWLWLPVNSPEQKKELAFGEIRHIVDQARSMGCQAWAISGGEPLLRPDFFEIFDYITRKSVSYKLNTNGTLITPKIAQLLQRKGNTMVALYGATAEVHDHITRTPGSFEATMQGMAYLKEAGAGFTIQLIPMQGNFHQYKQMVTLAESLSPFHRVGASWLWLSANQSEKRNHEIGKQRLTPSQVIQLEQPNPADELLSDLQDKEIEQDFSSCGTKQDIDFLFLDCIQSKRDFHIDPYGMMSFCYHIKDPKMRFNLREGTFQQAWDEFIPSLGKIIRGGPEYQENCGSCELKKDCHWCGVYGYLEHGRYTAKVDYLCRVAEQNRRYKDEWKDGKIRYYQIAGITIQLTSDFIIRKGTFSKELEKFQVEGPGKENIAIRLLTTDLDNLALRPGKEVYRKLPWAIYQHRSAWVYMGIANKKRKRGPHVVAITNQDYSRINIVRNTGYFEEYKNANSLTTFPSDQILLAQVVANHKAFYIHASGIILGTQGYLFVGHSGAGKSTMLKLLRDHGEILCDDRMIIRRWPERFRIHGTWSHGELPDVSPASAPLRAILFLEKAKTNELIPIESKQEKLAKILSHVVRPLLTTEWWEKIMNLAGQLIGEVPVYTLKFEKSGKVIDAIHMWNENQKNEVPSSPLK